MVGGIDMNDLIVKNVDLFGDTIVAAKDKDGVIWAGVRWFCDGMGLSDGQRQRQITNIGEDIVLSKGVANLNLPTNGGNQDILCLKLDFIPLWLAKISITPNMKENNPELVEKLVKYQLQAKDVLAAAFIPAFRKKSAIEELQELQGRAILEVNAKVEDVENRIIKLENNMTITHEQIQIIKNRVNARIVNDVMGGYESNAYNDIHLRSKVYSRFNKDYCDYFRINARANTLAVKFDEALRYIDMWEPDTNMKLMIKNANAQMKIEDIA